MWRLHPAKSFRYKRTSFPASQFASSSLCKTLIATNVPVYLSSARTTVPNDPVPNTPRTRTIKRQKSVHYAVTTGRMKQIHLPIMTSCTLAEYNLHDCETCMKLETVPTHLRACCGTGTSPPAWGGVCVASGESTRICRRPNVTTLARDKCTLTMQDRER